MENHSSRMAHGEPKPARTPSSHEQRSSSVFVHEAVVQHVTYYVTDFESCIPFKGTTPRNFRFSGTGVVAALQPVR